MEKLKNLLRPFGLILSYFAIQVCLQLIFLSLNIENTSISMLVYILIDLAATSFVVFVFRQKLKDSIEKFKKKHKECISTALSCWVVGLISMMLANVIVMQIAGGMAPNEEANREVITTMLPYALTSICICAPIAEEILFRMNFRETIKNDKIFLLVTSVIFGSMHIIGTYQGPLDILYVFPYSILGFALGKAYVDTDSIISSIMIHVLHNSLVVAMVIFGI